MDFAVAPETFIDLDPIMAKLRANDLTVFLERLHDVEEALSARD